jgi:autotransporter-associated beta strand protein
MGKSGGSKAIAGAALAAAMLSGPAALAHTSSVGYEILPSNTVEIWYGTYHSEANFTEGSLSFIGDNGYSSLVPFSDLVTIRPAGLVDGTTNFYSNGTSLVGTPNTTIYVWQGVTFSNLQAGTYTFAYVPIASPTSQWDPINAPIKTGSFVLSAAALGAAAGDVIGTGQADYLASAMSPTGPLKFQGGTLKSDIGNATLAQDFTIDSAGGTIDQAGNSATLSGVISDATPGTAGALTVTNSSNGGAVVLSGVSTYTGATTVAAGATIALSGAGSIASSSGVALNGGALDIAATSNGAVVTNLTGENGRVTLGDKTLTVSAASGSFGGTIFGNGGVTIAGGNQTMTSGQAYTGATQIDSGAALTIVGNGGGIYNSGNVVDNGKIDVSGATFPTAFNNLSGSGMLFLGTTSTSLRGAGDNFAGNISGTGAVIIDATKQRFSGNNYFTGLAQIGSTSTLALSGNGSVGNASGVVVGGMFDVSAVNGSTLVKALYGNGSVNLGGSYLAIGGSSLGDGYFNGSIGGTGGIAIFGGKQVLTGVNTYTSGTQVFAGATLALIGNGSIASSTGATVDGVLDISNASAGAAVGSLGGAGSVALGANSLTLNGAYDTFAGTISGNGGLTVAAGTETLSGVNSYTGATQVNHNAKLVLAGNGGIAATSNVLLDGGQLDIATTTAGASVGGLAGNAGLVTLGNKTLTLSAASGTFGGNIDGSGGLTVAGGVQTINAGLSYTGTTQVNQGARLIILGNGGGVYRSANVLNNGVIDVSGATFPTTFNNLAGKGTLALGATNTSLGGAGADFAGSISGSGSIFVSAGKQTFSGVNSYTGLTQVGAGATLALSNASSIAASSGVVSNGTLDISASTPGAGASIASLSGSGAVALGANQLVLSKASGSFSGNISGTGGLFVNAGTQTLTGVNSYSGLTQIGTGATLAIAGNGAITGSSGVLNNGTLTIASSLPSVMTSLAGSGILNLVNQSITFTQGADNFTGSITGTGTVSVIGGVQQLSGVNTISGPVSATSGGVLRVASDASLGATGNGIILNNGTLNTTGTLTMARTVSITGTGTAAVDSGTTLTANGAFSGSGTLVKTGTGTLVLGGDNSALTGGATINGGTVKLSSSNAVGSGAVQLNAGTLESAVSLTLAQNVAVAGGTSILTDAATTTVLSGSVSSAGGNGCFSKTGAGTLNLTGTATFGSGLCVDQGTLRVNGLTGSGLVAVAAGATLRGTGKIDAPITVSGTLAPGNSPGTLTTSATVTMAAGSNFQEDINGTGTASGPGNYSRLLVTGAGQFVAGNATLTPNLVNITGVDTYTPYVPKVGDNYRIVSAAGGVVGRFGTIVQPVGLAANTRLAAFYNGDGTNSIDLRVLPTSYSAYSLANGGTRNAQRAGVALDSIMTADQAATATATQARLAYAVSNLSGSSVAAVTQNLSGEVHAAMAAIAPLAGQAVQGSVQHQLDTASVRTGVDGAGASITSALWADLAGNRAEWDKDANASGFVANRGQLTLGADAFRSDAGRIGVGFSHARANLSAEGGSGTLRENMAFVYGNYQGSGLGIDAMAGAGRTSWETERANPLGAGALRTGLDGRNTLASIGISAPWQVDGATFKPFVRVLWQRTERDAGSEGMGALAALSLGEYAASGTRAMAGLSGNAKGGDIGRTPYTMQYSFGVGRDNGALARSVVDSSMAGISSTIVAPHAGRAFVQAAVSGTVMHSAKASSFYGVAAEMHGGRSDVSLSGGLRYAF